MVAKVEVVVVVERQQGTFPGSQRDVAVVYDMWQQSGKHALIERVSVRPSYCTTKWKELGFCVFKWIATRTAIRSIITFSMSPRHNHSSNIGSLLPPPLELPAVVWFFLNHALVKIFERK
jgi:hypothetical protein